MNRSKYVKYDLGGLISGLGGNNIPGLESLIGSLGGGGMPGLGDLGGLLGSTVASIDAADGNLSVGGSALSGALKGAGTGLAFGPLGALAGGVLGGGIGLVGGILNKNAAEKQEMEERAEFSRQMSNIRANRSRSILSTYPTKGTETHSYYKYGGGLPWRKPDYMAEGGEVVEFDMFDKPVAYNGSLNQLSSDLSEIKGPSHNQSSGGVGMSGGERIFSDSMSIPPSLSKYFKV